MFDSEQRLISEALHISAVISGVCTIAQNSSYNKDIAELAAGYFKAKLYNREELAKKLWSELSKAYGPFGDLTGPKIGPEFKGIEELSADGIITVQEAAFCHNYLCE